MNTAGLRVLSRKSYEAHAVSVYDNPLSACFDENDALLYFDNVKVPWERVFVHRDTDMCRAQFHDTPSHIFQNYQAQIRLSVKMRFLVGLAHKITEAIGTTNMPQVREQLGMLAAHAGTVEGMLSGMEALGSNSGAFYLPNRHLLYAAQVTTQDLYPRMINSIRDLAGGALIMLPSSFRDWSNEEIAPILRKTQRSPSFSPEDKVKLLKAAWDAIGSEFASRHTQYEMFYAGARFVATGHSYRTFDWGKARGMVDHLLSTYQLEEPTRSALE
jgi:4-hydroxyphenylacetate 3-monooxygenase